MKKTETKSAVLLKHHLKAPRLPTMTDENDLGLIQLARSLLWYRRLHRMDRCDVNNKIK